MTRVGMSRNCNVETVVRLQNVNTFLPNYFMANVKCGNQRVTFSEKISAARIEMPIRRTSTANGRHDEKYELVGILGRIAFSSVLQCAPFVRAE